MRKTVLIMLMGILFANPCLAREIETQGFLTSNNTLWKTVCDKDRYKCIFYDYIGFSGNTVYYGDLTPQLGECLQSLVLNFGLFSFYWATVFQNDEFSTDMSGFVSSMLGIGTLRREDTWLEIYTDTSTSMIRKIDSYWMPTPAFVEIWPTTGEQSSTLTRVVLICENTSFEDDGVHEIVFSPPDGIMVSDINVISYNTIEFDIDISVDTPVGFKSVTVIWDEGKQVTTGNNVFWVRRATN